MKMRGGSCEGRSHSQPGLPGQGSAPATPWEALPAETVRPAPAALPCPEQQPWDGLDLRTLLDLQAVDDDCHASRHADSNTHGVLFGGQLLGQTLMAALRTVPADRPPHALQAVFLHGGKAHLPLAYRVGRTRDGAAFSHRRVEAWQAGQAVLSGEISFHAGEAGDQQSHSAPPDVPPPEALPAAYSLPERLGMRLPPAVGQRLSRRRPGVDVRLVDPEALLARPDSTTRMAWWLRVVQPLPEAASWHLGALAYLSDHWMGAAFRLLPGAAPFPGPVFIASLNHALWIHRTARADDWLLMVADVPSEGMGRRLNRAEFFDRDGRLVASAAQEALLRPGA